MRDRVPYTTSECAKVAGNPTRLSVLPSETSKVKLCSSVGWWVNAEVSYTTTVLPSFTNFQLEVCLKKSCRTAARSSVFSEGVLVMGSFAFASSVVLAVGSFVLVVDVDESPTDGDVDGFREFEVAFSPEFSVSETKNAFANDELERVAG